MIRSYFPQLVSWEAEQQGFDFNVVVRSQGSLGCSRPWLVVVALGLLIFALSFLGREQGCTKRNRYCRLPLSSSYSNSIVNISKRPFSATAIIFPSFSFRLVLDQR